jgi:hypothetical protein
MDLETAHTKSVPPERRNAILAGAFRSRQAELQEFWKHLTSSARSESLDALGPQVGSFLSGHGPISNSALPETSTWLSCDKDFWDCLLAVALARPLECRAAGTSPAPLPVAVLKKLSGADRFEALTARYRCPLNIGLPSELPIAEELLRQLMVVDRVKLEEDAAYDVDNVLLALNLVGIRALLTHDLRSLDALNYFYELPQPSLIRMRSNLRLLASWLCIYAQLLSSPDWLKCA